MDCPNRIAHDEDFTVHFNHYTRISSPSDSLFKRQGDTLYLCAGDTVPMFSSLGGVGKWRVIAGPSMQLGVNFGSDTLISTWAAPSSTTTYELSQEAVTCSGSKTVRDTLVISVVNDYNLAISTTPKYICVGTEDSLESLVQGVSSSQVNYNWTAVGIVGANSHGKVVIKPEMATEVLLRGESNDGCIRYATHLIGVVKSVQSRFILRDSSSICTDDSVFLSMKSIPNVGVASYVDLSTIDTTYKISEPLAYRITESADQTTLSANMYPNPFGPGGKKYVRQQFLYPSSTLGISGKVLLKELVFHLHSITSGDSIIDNISIRISQVSDSILWGWKPKGDLMFDDSVDLKPGAIHFPFNSPFIYDGSKHLVVEICVSDEHSVTATTSYYDPMQIDASLASFDDTTKLCSNRTSIGMRSKKLPVIGLGFTSFKQLKPFNIQWSNPIGMTTPNGIQTAIYDSIPRNVYLTFTDTLGVCTFTDTISIDTVAFIPIQTPGIDTICFYDSVRQVNVSPLGGEFSGYGISKNGLLTPSVLPPRENIFTYTIRPKSLCPLVDTFLVYLSPRIFVRHPDIDSICETEVSLVANGGTPLNGTYDGKFISQQGLIDIQGLGVGLKKFEYQVSDARCRYSDSFSLYIAPIQRFEATGMEDFCASDSVNTVSLGNPLGGYYFGDHIDQNGDFNISSAGVGIHNAYYSGYSRLKCVDTAQVSIRVYPIHQHGINGDSAVFTSKSNFYQATNLDTGSTYTWVSGWGQQIAVHGNNRDFQWPMSGVDTLTLIGENPGCGSDTVTFQVTIEEKDDEGGSGGTGLFDSKSKDVILSIYPIPAADKLSIQSSAALTSVELYTLDMKLLFAKELPNEMQSSIDVSNLPTGVYFLQLKGEWGNAVKRVQLVK